MTHCVIGDIILKLKVWNSIYSRYSHLCVKIVFSVKLIHFYFTLIADQKN